MGIQSAKSRSWDIPEINDPVWITNYKKKKKKGEWGTYRLKRGNSRIKIISKTKP